MATEEAARREEDDDPPELLVKLRDRKERHKQRSIPHRIAIVLLGLLIVLAGLVMSGPGVPGPGIAVILIGLGFLALEFDWAERLLERAIIWADNAKDRAEQTSTKQRVLAGLAGAVAVAAFVVAAILWDIPLLPIV
ncbi:MAG TPA: PGPGW domain-containing protein [Thermoleophilaceae bacterium]|nr:PGPGW domain-containing protein [Thermoleophilaceae bacterium]